MSPRLIDDQLFCSNSYYDICITFYVSVKTSFIIMNPFLAYESANLLHYCLIDVGNKLQELWMAFSILSAV